MSEFNTLVKSGFEYDVAVLRPRWWVPRKLARNSAFVRRHTGLFFREDKSQRERIHNLMPTEGLNHTLSVTFAGGSQVATWYVGLFEGNYTPLSTNTMATFPAAATESTAYDESVRRTWVESTPAAGATTNSASKAEFTMSATKTIYGAFISSSSVKGGTTGVLASAAKFSSAKTVDDGDILRVTASISLTSS